MDRREFFKISAGGALGLALPWQALARSGRDHSYSVVILGDTHFDDMDSLKYHAGYTLENKKREAAHRKEFLRNGLMWNKRCPELVKRAACLVDDNTRFILQMGDLIQGDTADAATHRRFLADAMDLFKRELAPELPFVTVAGNHDLRGSDDAVATQAYLDYMPARMSEELGKEITGTNFSFTVGEDTYVVLDFTHPDLGAIERLLTEADSARHLFVIVHCPVFPYDSKKYFWWFLMGGKKDPRPEERRYVRRLLAEREAIVLCGHVHRTELLDWYGDGGRITQMTMSSVWAMESQGSYRVLAEGKNGYGSVYFPGSSLKTPETEALFEEYREGIRRYSMADAAGSYKLSVGKRGIFVDFYAGSSPRLTQRFRLR